jgi:hypothetical protein
MPLYVLSVNIPKTKNCTYSDLVKQGDHNPLLTFKKWICVQCEVMHCLIEKGHRFSCNRTGPQKWCQNVCDISM